MSFSPLKLRFSPLQLSFSPLKLSFSSQQLSFSLLQLSFSQQLLRLLFSSFCRQLCFSTLYRKKNITAWQLIASRYQRHFLDFLIKLLTANKYCIKHKTTVTTHWTHLSVYDNCAKSLCPEKTNDRMLFLVEGFNRNVASEIIAMKELPLLQSNRALL